LKLAHEIGLAIEGGEVVRGVNVFDEGGAFDSSVGAVKAVGIVFEAWEQEETAGGDHLAVGDKEVGFEKESAISGAIASPDISGIVEDKQPAQSGAGVKFAWGLGQCLDGDGSKGSAVAFPQLVGGGEEKGAVDIGDSAGV
jgi:hypothetical protein